MSEFTQAVIVTLVAAGALGVLLRPLLPRRKASASSTATGCPSCASGPGCTPSASQPPRAATR